MGRVVIDVTMSLDGYVAGPDDGPEHPLGLNDGRRIFSWYNSGGERLGSTPLFRPEAGVNRKVVDQMLAESGAFIVGRRTYDIANGWNGTHPVNAAPVFILTHKPPPASKVPQGASKITFVTDGIASAIRQAKAAAGVRQVKLGGASPCQQALEAGLVDEILLHVAPYLLGGGVRLFDALPRGVELKKLGVRDGPLATHMHYKVMRG